MTTALSYRPVDTTQPWEKLQNVNWGWLFRRSPMIALALLSSWGVGGFIMQSGRAEWYVALVGSGAFDLVFLGVIALADQGLSTSKSSHILYWVLNIGAATIAALLNTLYYSGGTYAGITAETITHGAPFAVFGLLYSLYYHSVMSEAIEKDTLEQQRIADMVLCRYCGQECRNKAAEYSHYRTCPKHPKNQP